MLEIDPDNGYAAAHLGFVKYVYERDAAGGAPLLVQGLNSGDDRVTRDNRFYSKAGDALYRVGQKEQVLSYIFMYYHGKADYSVVCFCQQLACGKRDFE